MATIGIKPVPADDTPATPERRVEHRETAMDRIEDRLDYLAVCNARTAAAARGEKPMAWEEFKKKLRR